MCLPAIAVVLRPAIVVALLPVVTAVGALANTQQGNQWLERRKAAYSLAAQHDWRGASASHSAQAYACAAYCVPQLPKAACQQLVLPSLQLLFLVWPFEAVANVQLCSKLQ